MSIINNTYNSTTIANDQIGIALEDFLYGEKAKISIPSLIPFYSGEDEDNQKETINKKNIMNKKQLSFNSKAVSCNYIEIDIPKELYRPGSSIIPYQGYKGDKFVVSFLGGNIDYPIVLRRI